MTHTLHCGDCIEYMATMPDNSVDAIIADPPYGTTACKWDSVIPFDLMWAQLKRVIKPKGAIVLFGQEPFSSLLRTSNLDWYKYDWVWRKTKGSNFLHAPNMPLKVTEDVLVFSPAPIGHIALLKDRRMTYNPQGITNSHVTVRQNKNRSDLKYHRDSQSNHKAEGYKCKNANYPTSLVFFDSESDTVHPTQKPVDLMAYLVKTYTNPGDTVLDFTMGSGSTGVACVQEGRNFIGIDITPEYVGIARQRLEHAAQQMPLLDER